MRFRLLCALHCCPVFLDFIDAPPSPPGDMQVLMHLPEVHRLVCASVNRCYLPIDQLIGRASFRKYAYVNGACKEFIYGVVGGNENRFDSKEKCEWFCGRHANPLNIFMCDAT
ncbi:unnamed protein product [Dibothriocephalus latus]|uniref:BPTI/Kunitz inhibitor domain-containing protein n=1 Tax=Dibothriocephalus latus TaxID=60516 RepID=A0A3P7LZ07_DIBLA|nr:unnamed protein product [Dibothriocephalus latus]